MIITNDSADSYILSNRDHVNTTDLVVIDKIVKTFFGKL